MPKQKKTKLNIDKNYQDRIDNIERILNEYNVKVDNSSSILAQHVIEFKEVVKELHTKVFENKEEVKCVNNKLDSILNVRVNGYVGLENILKVIVESTKSHRANRELFNSIKNWLNTHKTIKSILQSKPVDRALTIIIVLLFISFLNYIGVSMPNPIDIITNYFK